MANPERGQISMKAGGLTYTMQLSPNSLSLLKQETGLGINGVIKAFQEQGDDPDFGLVGAFVWASLQDHHPEMTVADAARLLPDGGIPEIIRKIGETLTAAFGSAPNPAGAAPSKNPRKATTKK